MPRLVECLIWGMVVLAPLRVFGHSKTSSIDTYCESLRAEFASTSPFVFSGPDPWTKMDEVPAAMPDDALAFVYTTGPNVRWVFLRITDGDGAWSEDIDYFYREDGSIAKRIRHLSSIASNVSLDVTTYYIGGRVIKEKAHHHALSRGKTDSSRFSDPDAPVFATVDDLPFSVTDDVWKRLA